MTEPSSFNINPTYSLSSKQIYEGSYYATGILNGNRFILSEAITIIESESHVLLAENILNTLLLQPQPQSCRIAVTGAPGVGKSTFIEALGMQLIDKNHKVAVLAIDPSSAKNKGSILGDKTRMNKLSINENAFIRPSSAGSLLGGISRGTKEAITLCEYAGYSHILVETVGTGQSEYLASYLTDMTIFLVQPGAGDELQGIKRGIMEVADLILVNKSEDNIAAQKTAASYESALSLFPPKFLDFYPKIIKISSLHNQGIDEVSNYISKFFQHIQKSNLLADHRNMQELYWYDSFIKDIIYQNIISNPKIAALYSSYRKDIEDKKSTSYLSSLQFIENIKSLLS